MASELTNQLTLLPCPFCGGEAKLHRTESGFALAFCSNQDCVVEPEIGSRADDVDIIKAWNIRYLPSE